MLARSAISCATQVSRAPCFTAEVGIIETVIFFGAEGKGLESLRGQLALRLNPPIYDTRIDDLMVFVRRAAELCL